MASWCLDKSKTLLAEALNHTKPFMADWQVSTSGVKFCPKATLPLSTQIAAYLMVLSLTGLYSKILLMAMLDLKSRELHWSVIKTLVEPKIINRVM